ncbi:MAG: glycosyltransferase [bacterium]
MIKILSFPSRHPYMAKFHGEGGLEFVNPETDYFNGYGGHANIDYIQKTHPPESYDIVHIHFSFDKLPIHDLESLLNYFKRCRKPIIWTCHSRESQRERHIGGGEYQKLLYTKADQIITLTNGCKDWVKNNLGSEKNISVIPHGYIINPKSVTKYRNDLRKKKEENFIFLAGELRKNKEIIQSIINFLQCDKLIKCKLTVLFKPFAVYSDHDFEIFDERNLKFWNLVNSSERINIISLSEISNDLLYSNFLKSHVCLLPYLWGTHSGQIELSRDSMCQVVVSDVGFYKEQNNNIIEYKLSENPSSTATNFTEAMIEAYKRPLSKSLDIDREEEFSKILEEHIKIYKKYLNKN